LIVSIVVPSPPLAEAVITDVPPLQVIGVLEAVTCIAGVVPNVIEPVIKHPLSSEAIK
jgi:hypothetical protein